MADFQSVQVQRLAQPFDLRLGHLDLGAAQLGEILRPHVGGQFRRGVDAVGAGVRYFLSREKKKGTGFGSTSVGYA